MPSKKPRRPVLVSSFRFPESRPSIQFEYPDYVTALAYESGPSLDSHVLVLSARANSVSNSDSSLGIQEESGNMHKDGIEKGACLGKGNRERIGNGELQTGLNWVVIWSI